MNTTILLEGGKAIRYKTQNNAEKKQAAIRIITLAFLVCFVMVSLLSEAFIFSHLHHEHDHNGVGGNCATCAQIHSTENTLKQLIATIGGASFSISGLFAFMSVLCVGMFLLDSQTLVKLKIQMNN